MGRERGETYVGPAQCPFYLRERRAELFCESCIPKAETIHDFKSQENMAEYKLAVCYDADGFRTCPWYNFLMSEKYGMSEVI